MQSKWLDRSLFFTNYYFTLCTTEKQFKKVLKHLKLPKQDYPPFMKTSIANATVHYFETGDGKRAAVVCLGDCTGKEMSAIFGLLVHEAVHIWQNTAKDLGETEPSSELEAYAIQHLSLQLFWEYERQTNVSPTD